MNLIGRPATAAMGAAGAGLATYAIVSVLARDWTGCDTHLEPGSRGALAALFPFLFVLVAAGGAFLGSATGWTGLRERADDPEVVRLLGVAVGILLTAFALVLLLGGSADPSACPVP